MADVLFVCVREDVAKAEALADLFEDAGFSISDAGPSADAMRASGACVVLWSSAATASSTFLALTQRAMASGRAIVANFNGAAAPPSTEQAPVFNLADWDGEGEGAAYDPLFDAVDQLVMTRREEHDVAALAQEVIDSLRDEDLRSARPRNEPVEIRSAWTAELPTTFIARPRAIRARQPAFSLPRVSTARTFAAIALVGASALFASLTLGATPTRATIAVAPIELSVRAPTPVQDFAMIEEPIVEPEPEPVISRGLEPPSVETVRRAPRARSERVREHTSVAETTAALTPASVTAPVEEHATGSSLAGPRRAKREKPGDHA